MPSVDELAADDPYDVEAATRAAKKMTSNQLRDRLTAAAADASGLKPALVEKWVATAREVAVAKKTKRVTGKDVARVFAARLKRAEPTRTSLYTGNEGMESGYIYTSAVIKLGESGISDY